MATPAEVAAAVRESAELMLQARPDDRATPAELEMITAIVAVIAERRPGITAAEAEDLVWPIFDDIINAAEGEQDIVIPIDDIGSAMRALKIAVEDAEHDNGPGAGDAGYNDLVRSVADQCLPEVAAELFRRTGVQPL